MLSHFIISILVLSLSSISNKQNDKFRIPTSIDKIFIIYNKYKKQVKNYLGNNDAIVGDVIYKSDMVMNVYDPEVIELRETFKNRKNGKKRQNIQKFYTPDQSIILSEIKDCGFNMLSQFDLVSYDKPFQYIYVLYKPAN